MINDQHDRSATSAPSAEILARTPMSQPCTAAPGTTIPTKNALASRQAQLDQHRQGVVQEITKASADLEMVPEAEVTKRLSVRKTIKALEDQLGMIAEEQADLDRQKEALLQKEHQARVEEVARTQKEVQKNGLAAADTMRHTLGLLEQQYGQWRELKERERICRDILRSLGPSSEQPFFSFATGVDDNFEIALGQAFRELHRSQADLYARTHATEIQQQQEAVRQQDQLAADADRARRQTMAVKSA